MVVAVTVTSAAATASAASVAARGVVAAFFRWAVCCHGVGLYAVGLRGCAEIAARCRCVCISRGIGTAGWALAHALVAAFSTAVCTALAASAALTAAIAALATATAGFAALGWWRVCAG